MIEICKTNAQQDILAGIYHLSVITREQKKHYKITCEYSPLASNYSRALLDIRYYTCKYLYVHSNTHAFLVYSRTSQEISVKCSKVWRRA